MNRLMRRVLNWALDHWGQLMGAAIFVALFLWVAL